MGWPTPALASRTTPPLVSSSPVKAMTSMLRSHTMIVPHNIVSPSTVPGSCTACEHDGLAMATWAALQPADPKQELMALVGDVPLPTAVLMHDCWVSERPGVAAAGSAMAAVAVAGARSGAPSRAAMVSRNTERRMEIPSRSYDDGRRR